MILVFINRVIYSVYICRLLTKRFFFNVTRGPVKETMYLAVEMVSEKKI